MTNEITKKEDNFLVPSSNTASSWGEPPKLRPKDIIIPRMQLMQGMSEKVTAGEAIFGEIRDSVSGELLGSTKQPIEIIPLSMKKTIIVSLWNGKNDYDYSETIPATEENEALPYLEEKVVQRTHVSSFFVLLPSEMSTGGAIPKVLSIKGQSRQAGKILATQMYAINASAQPWLPPSAYTMILSSKIDKNDKGTFAIFEAKRGRLSTEAENTEALKWFKAFQSNEAPKIDEDEIDEVKVSAEKTFKTTSKAKTLQDPPNF